MPKVTRKPGDLLKMMRAGGSQMHRAMKLAGIKHTGTFHGKSNALGHGGRAAQLKARGVPGGVIGNLARAAHAAPGQENYHGKKAKRRKVSAPEKQHLGIALKKHKKSRKNIGHDGKIIDPKPTGTKLEHHEEGKHEFKSCKKCKAAHKMHAKKKHSK